MQALDTVVPFYAVLLASASTMSLLAHFHHDVHHDDVMLVMAGVHMVVWIQFLPNASAVKPSFNPSCYFFTVNLVAFIFDQCQPHFLCNISKGCLVHCMLHYLHYYVVPPSVLWLSHHMWLSNEPMITLDKLLFTLVR